MSHRIVVKFKDGSHCNLAADFVHFENGIAQAWNGETLVGVFNIVDIVGLYLAEKKGEG